MVARRDFTYEEWSDLLKLYRHEEAKLTKDIDRKFSELGLTEGNGLTNAGKVLVATELLMERRNRLQR